MQGVLPQVQMYPGYRMIQLESCLSIWGLFYPVWALFSDRPILCQGKDRQQLCRAHLDIVSITPGKKRSIFSPDKSSKIYKLGSVLPMGITFPLASGVKERRSSTELMDWVWSGEFPPKLKKGGNKRRRGCWVVKNNRCPCKSHGRAEDSGRFPATHSEGGG